MRAERAPWNRVSPLLAISVTWAVLLGLPDLVAHRPYLASASRIDCLTYLAALAGSWALFVGSIAGLLRLRSQWPRAALLASVLFGIWIGVAVVLAVPYRVRFGQDLPASYLSFLVQNPSYGWRLFRAETGTKIRWLMGGGAVTVVLVLVLFTRARHTRSIPVRTAQILAVLGAVAMLFNVAKKRASLPADFHEARVAVATVSLLSTPGRLPLGARPVLAPIATTVRPNVLLLLGESLSAEEWSPWAERSDGPGLAPFLAAHPGFALVPMHDAKSSAPATDVSVPSILTGLRSDSSSKDFARAPLLWHEARARGYKTALFSSQDYSWLHLGDFLLGPDAPDVVRVMKDFPGAKQVNDGAIDDALAVDAANQLIDSMPADQPYFVVVHFNATHFPGWAPGLEVIPQLTQEVAPRESSRRAQALVYMETLQRRLLEHLEQKGTLDETLVVCTSDHGVNSRPNPPARLESHYDDVLRVPLGVQLPRSVREARPDAMAALVANATQRTSNQDIFPTVLDVWNTSPQVGPERPALLGSSLLRPLPERALLSMSTGPVRGWHRHGMALYEGRYKWLVDEHDGLRVFDLAADPHETKNVFASVPPGDRDRFEIEVRKSPPALRLLEDVAPELLAD